MRPVRERARSVSYREPNESEVYREPDPVEVAAADRRAAAKRAKPEAGREPDGRGGRRRATGKESPLDALAVEYVAVEGSEGCTYSLGGAEVGGTEADRILGEVEADESIIKLMSQFSCCRRIVLFQQGRAGRRAVAAAVIELHLGGSTSGGVLEVPILASARTARGQGHGSFLVALLVELASSHLASPAQGVIPQGSQGAVAMLVSSTDEARRFWLSQGCRVLSNCSPAVASAIRGLNQRGGQRFGHFHTTSMARELPDPRVLPAGSPPNAPGRRGVLVSAALARLRARVAHSRGLTPTKAAETLHYEDIPPGGSYTLSAGGGRSPMEYGELEGRTVHVPVPRLQAYPTDTGAAGAERSGWGVPGYGVRSTVPVRAGQTVLEICGKWISEEEHEDLPLRERSFCVSLDERARAVRRAAGDDRCWLDLREAGSIARVVRECSEAPNLELAIHPDPSAVGSTSAGAPFRLYFVAKHDVPPMAELVWERPAAGKRSRQSSSALARAAPAPAAAAPPLPAVPQSTGRIVEGCQAEIKMSEPELEGARFGATVLAAGRADGLFRVRYTDLFSSGSSDETLAEWVEPRNVDELRPPPPPPPDGFHAQLGEGDVAEMLFEAGWWPVRVRRGQSQAGVAIAPTCVPGGAAACAAGAQAHAGVTPICASGDASLCVADGAMGAVGGAPMCVPGGASSSVHGGAPASAARNAHTDAAGNGTMSAAGGTPICAAGSMPMCDSDGDPMTGTAVVPICAAGGATTAAGAEPQGAAPAGSAPTSAVGGAPMCMTGGKAVIATGVAPTPVTLAVPLPAAFEVESSVSPSRFQGLSGRVSAVRLRPAWVWEGRSQGGKGKSGGGEGRSGGGEGRCKDGAGRSQGGEGRWLFPLKAVGTVWCDQQGRTITTPPASVLAPASDGKMNDGKMNGGLSLASLAPATAAAPSMSSVKGEASAGLHSRPLPLPAAPASSSSSAIPKPPSPVPAGAPTGAQSPGAEFVVCTDGEALSPPLEPTAYATDRPATSLGAATSVGATGSAMQMAGEGVASTSMLDGASLMEEGTSSFDIASLLDTSGDFMDTSGDSEISRDFVESCLRSE